MDFRSPGGNRGEARSSTARRNAGTDAVTLHSEEGVDLPGRLIAPKTAGRKPAYLVLGDELPRGVADSDRVILALPPRPSPPGTEAAKSPLQGSFYLLSLRAELVGKTILGMRVDDIIRAVDWLAARPDVDPSVDHGLRQRRVRRRPAARRRARSAHRAGRCVEDTPPSFRTIVDDPLHRNAPEIVVPGVLRYYDIPDLIKAIAPRPVTITHSN